MTKTKDHLIRSVANQTGLSQHTLRIWERRYNAVVPDRSDTKRRAYSDEDIERLKLLKTLTQEDYRIGQIAQLPLNELRELSHRVENRRPLTSEDALDNNNLIDSCIGAIRKLDPQAFDVCLAQASITMSPMLIIEELMIPLMNLIGNHWRKGTLRAVHAQFAASLIRPFLLSLIKGHNTSPAHPLVIGALLPGQFYEFGVFFSLSAASSIGWRTTYLGPSLPAEEIAAGVHQLKPAALVLNLVHPYNDPVVYRELRQLKKLMPQSVRIVTGGPSAEVLLAGATRPEARTSNGLKGNDAYSKVLDEIGASRATSLSDVQMVLENVLMENDEDLV